MPELERCWLCHKICDRPWNPPDIALDDMCQCAKFEEVPTDRELIEEGFEELKEMLRERRHAGN